MNPEPFQSAPPQPPIEMVGPWECDTCGLPIESAADGVVMWLDHLERGNDSASGLAIVHRIPASPRGGPDGCYPGVGPGRECDERYSVLADIDLTELIGPDGLSTLLALAETSKLPSEEVHQVVMRLFVPGYERARPYFRRAIVEGLVGRNVAGDYYRQEQLTRIAAEYIGPDGSPR